MKFVCIFPNRKLFPEPVESTQLEACRSYSFLFVRQWGYFFSESGIDFASSIIFKMISVHACSVDTAYITLIFQSTCSEQSVPSQATGDRPVCYIYHIHSWRSGSTQENGDRNIQAGRYSTHDREWWSVCYLRKSVRLHVPCGTNGVYRKNSILLREWGRKHGYKTVRYQWQYSFHR